MKAFRNIVCSYSPPKTIWKSLHYNKEKHIYVHSLLTKSYSHKLSGIMELWVNLLLHLEKKKKSK